MSQFYSRKYLLAIVLIVAGHCLFSYGLWGVRIALAEETMPIGEALSNAGHLKFTGDFYVNLYTVLIAFVAPDPLTANIAMRFLASLLSVISLFLLLTRFSNYLRIESILFTTFVWLASRLNAPIAQPTNQNLIAFSAMLLAAYAVLSPKKSFRSWGFLGFGGLAVSLRPEYLAPALLIAAWFAGEAVWRWLGPGVCFGRFSRRQILAMVCASLFVCLVAVGWSRPGQKFSAGLGRYLLFGWGQCYAAFYKSEHPEVPFDAMTEYHWLLNEKFGNPSKFSDIIRNNPREAFRYCTLNTFQNLRKLPEELLSTRSMSSNPLILRPHSLLLFGVLALGSACAVFQIGKWARSGRPGEGWRKRISPFLKEHAPLARKLAVVLLLGSASSVAIIILVASPRYWISLVPAIYLMIAFCCESLLRTIHVPQGSRLLCLAAFGAFCWPNFLMANSGNFEIHALRFIAPQIRDRPVVGALWADPFCVFGFRGRAVGVSAWDGIKARDIEDGKFDVLILDRGFRASRTWAEQRAFFEEFERGPAQFGFRKLTEVGTARRDIYFRPTSPAL